MGIRIARTAERWLLEGSLDRNSVVLLKQWQNQLLSHTGTIHLELSELEIGDSDGACAAVDIIRLLLDHYERVVLYNAPQTLAHIIYRAGMLEDNAKLQLSNWREEEPYA